MPAALADDDRQLALEVEIDRGARPHDVAAVRHQGVVQPREDAGHGGKLPADLADVARIVEADAEDLVGVGDDRFELDIVELEVGRRTLGGRRQLAQGLGRDDLAQARPARRKPRRQIDDAAVDDRAEFWLRPHGEN